MVRHFLPALWVVSVFSLVGCDRSYTDRQVGTLRKEMRDNYTPATVTMKVIERVEKVETATETLHKLVATGRRSVDTEEEDPRSRSATGRDAENDKRLKRIRDEIRLKGINAIVSIDDEGFPIVQYKGTFRQASHLKEIIQREITMHWGTATPLYWTRLWSPYPPPPTVKTLLVHEESYNYTTQYKWVVAPPLPTHIGGPDHTAP